MEILENTPELSPEACRGLATLKTWLKESRKVCIFTGAGFSCPSGIPDFRSAKGIFSRKDGLTRSPEEIVSHEFFCENPEEFYTFYRSKMVYPTAKPNAAHRFAAALENPARQVTVVTQNIDGLHQAAGSTRVVELHGSVHRNRCVNCGARFGLQAIVQSSTPVPHCPQCGGLLKPEVVLYGEALEPEVIAAAVKAVETCDVLLVSGTSLAVYPAASFIGYYPGNCLAVLNLTPTPVDARANLTIYADVAAAARFLQE